MHAAPDPASLSVTERPDPVTAHLDRADPAERIRLLADHGEDLLERAGERTGLLDHAVLEACVAASRALRETLSSRRGRVVLCGAGTSGRLAFLVRRMVEGGLGPAGLPGGLRVLLAGGERALAGAVEGAEDREEDGHREAEAALEGEGPRVLVGVSCGLSSAWVAGAVRAALEWPGARAVVLGFNPPAMAGAAFRPALGAVRSRGDGVCILPVVGPEPLAGSTRMKAGSATLLLLASILEQAMEGSPAAVRDMERRLLRIREALAPFRGGEVVERLAELSEKAGSALLAGHALHHLGSGLSGLLGVLDAAECPPTFGARPDQVRARLEGGWASLLGEGDRARSLEDLCPLDQRGVRARPDGRGAGPLVVCTTEEGASLVWWKSGTRRMHLVDLGKAPDTVGRLLRLKTALNALSTAAFTEAGKVLGNRMVDLRIASAKLFQRAVRLVGEVAQVPREAALAAVVAAAHGVEAPGSGLLAAGPPVHVAAAAARDRVVPSAILVAWGVPLSRARETLEREASVHQALASLRPPP